MPIHLCIQSEKHRSLKAFESQKCELSSLCKCRKINSRFVTKLLWECMCLTLTSVIVLTVAARLKRKAETLCSNNYKVRHIWKKERKTLFALYKHCCSLLPVEKGQTKYLQVADSYFINSLKIFKSWLKNIVLGLGNWPSYCCACKCLFWFLTITRFLHVKVLINSSGSLHILDVFILSL